MFLSHIHSFRGIAIFGVIGTHCLHSLDWPPSSTSFRVIDTLTYQSSILFVFIAGLLFQHLSVNFTFRKYLKNKLLNVLIPYLLLSIPAIYASMFWIPQDSVPPSFYNLPVWQQIGLFLISGKHLAPFWFIPTIALFYLAAPLFIWIDRHPTSYMLVVPLILVSIYLGRDGLQAILAMPIIGSTPSRALYFLSVYLFGMLCGHYHNEILEICKKRILLLWGATITLFYLNYRFNNQQEGVVFIFKLITCLALLPLLSKFDHIIKNKLYIVGDVSFGLYFIHGYLLSSIKLLLPIIGFSPLIPAGIFNYLVFLIGVTTACSLLLVLARKLLGSKSRIIFGC